MTSPGSPSVVARCGRNPVPKIEAIWNYGQPSAQVLSYDSRVTSSTTLVVTRDEVADQADPAQPATEADEDRGDGRDPAPPVRRTASAQTTQREHARRTARSSGSRPG